MIARFVDIDGSVDHHCLRSLFIMNTLPDCSYLDAYVDVLMIVYIIKVRIVIYYTYFCLLLALP